MGFAIVGGGVKFREQRFNKTAARASATALTLAAVALTVPTIFHVTAAGRSGGWSHATEQKLSLAIAVVLFVTYACVLGFELITHKQLYAGDSQDGGEDRKEANGWSVSKSLLVLTVATSLVALMSEFLVGSVEAARSALVLTEVFVGVIVIAVIVAVHLIFQISGDGETNWLEGVQLLSVYLILGILFFYLPERAHAG